MLYVIAGVLIGAFLVLVFFAISVTGSAEQLARPADVPDATDAAFVELISLNTDTRFAGGNRIEVLLDGEETFRRLFQDLRAARRTITIQLYFCQPGRLAEAMAEILVERAAAGVRVLFLYDAFGSDMPTAYFDRLSDAGVEARVFRPVRWWSLHKAQERSHARIVVVDGAIGYTGGFGLSDHWTADGTDGEPGWRDTSARFTGSVVAPLQAAFAAGWAETAGELLVDASFYPEVRAGSADRARPTGREEPSVAGLLHSRPDVGSSTAERLLALSISAARHTLFVANAYFVPNDDFTRLFVDAVRRGVDVRILVPSRRTDMPLVRYAGRARYPELLAAGVRIYEFQPAMMHAKTFVIDGVWSAIGTLNFDNRSLAMNEESVLVVQDPDVGARMEAVFRDDLQRATEITAELFARRGLGGRLMEWLADLTSRFL